MIVDVHFQWFWKHGGYTHIRGLVAVLRILGLRGQFLDLNAVYSEPGSLMGNAETHLRERAESVHCIQCSIPTQTELRSTECPRNTLPTPHRLGASYLEWRCPVRTVDLDESFHGDSPESSKSS
jgi:hypothetical protein